MEFKELSVKRGKEHVLEVCTSEVVNLILPQCDVTIGEACYDDFTSGYNQALKDSKANEMLEMLINLTNKLKCTTEYEAGVVSFYELIKESEQLIKQATEL